MESRLSVELVSHMEVLNVLKTFFRDLILIPESVEKYLLLEVGKFFLLWIQCLLKI